MADLVTRLKLDDTQFNNNIRKSKKQINDFGRTCETVGKGISKAFAVFAAIQATIDTFSFAINSSTEATKLFSTTIDTAKTTVSNFFGSLISGDWSPFKKGIKESINLANQFAQAIDSSKKTNEWGTYYADYLEGKRNQIEHKITSDNTSTSEKKAAQQQYASIANEEQQVRQNIINRNLEAINSGLKSKGIDQQYTIDELMKMVHYVQTGNSKLTTQQAAFRDLLNANDFKPMFEAIITNTDKIGTLQKDWDDSISDVKSASEPSYSKGSLGYLNEQISKKETEYEFATDTNSRNKIYAEIEALKKEKHFIELEPKMSEAFKRNPTKFASEMPNLSDVKLDKIKLDETPSKWALSLADSFSIAGSSIMALGGAFAAFSDNAALGKSALILGAIGQLVFGYAQAAAKPMLPWEWIAFAISGAATLATVIAQISGYADGGIVNSPYTTGDRNLIKINGGEMVLTKGQQANLFNLLNTGTANNVGGEVKFKIEGKQLVGVLNNYNNKVSKLL